MESCLICGDTTAIIYTRPIAKVNQFLEQLGGLGQGLKFSKPSEVILCEDCRLGVVKATEWGDEMVKAERHLKNLQVNHLREMQKLEGKIRSSEVGGNPNEKAESFRQVILDVVMDLVKFEDVLSVNTSSISAAEPHKEQETLCSQSANDSLEVTDEVRDIDIDILEQVDFSEGEEWEQESLESVHLENTENDNDTEQSCDLPQREQSSAEEISGGEETTSTPMPSTSFQSIRKKIGKSRPPNPGSCEPPKLKKAKIRELLDSVDNEPRPSRDQSATPISDDVTAASHPLLVNAVLKNLFGYLSVEDLYSCRLVNTKWKLEALPHLKKRSRRFLQIRSYQHLCNYNCSAYFRQLSNYIKNSNPDEIPFSIEKVCFSKMHTDVQIYGAAWRELLAVLATRVTEINVLVREFSAPVIPTGIAFIQLTTLRVLKEKRDWRDWSDMQNLLECSPNLKTLELDDVDYDTIQLLSGIKGLNLHTFKLRSLFVMDGNQTPEDELVDFLQVQRNTLKHLVLGADINLEGYPDIAAELPNITITIE